MSEFDNNGFEAAETVETVETVENVETIDSSSDTVETTTAYDTPSYDAPSSEGSKVFGIISLVCGILSLLCCCTGWIGLVLSIAAIVLGILSINKQEDARGMAIAGIVCGGVGVILALIMVIMGAAFSAADATDIEQYVERFEDIL